MIACAWPWDGVSGADRPPLAETLASALCSGIGGKAAAAQCGELGFAWRPLHQRREALEDWQPARLGDGRLVIFHGYIDNPDHLSAELGKLPADPAQIYARAFEAWGESADQRIIGEYCAIIANPETRGLRLSRSPLRAPPLVYASNAAMVAAASVPRAIFAAGFDKVLDEDRVADSAMINFTDLEASWFKGLKRVPLGSVVELLPGMPRRLTGYYDLARVPRQKLPSLEAYVSRTRELLDEAVAATMRGFERPAATLSGGLDSPQVAVRAARALAPGDRLPTFTFHPEPGWDGITEPGTSGDERRDVEAFAALHPQLDPHFTANAGYGHDHRWNDLFVAMDGAPSGLCNMYVVHGLFEGARQQRRDLLLLAEWGNYTFSDKGDWGFVEYFLKGRWGQLWQALKKNGNMAHPLWYRFVSLCLVPLIPDPLWRLLQRIRHPARINLHDLLIPLRADYRERSGADRRWAQSGFVFERYQPRCRAHARDLLFKNLDADSAEIYQAYEQIYGVACRDPMAYRPFVEFCFGLPTELFLHNGEMRWLAKELGKGIMPEKQRANRLNGRWDADWLHRIKRRRADLLEELDRIEDDPELNAMLDVPRLRQALLDLPDKTPVDKATYMPMEMTLMRGLLTARFVNYTKGRN